MLVKVQAMRLTTPFQCCAVIPADDAPGDLALRHACQCFRDALSRFVRLHRTAPADPEDWDRSDTVHLAAARRQWSDALSEVSGLQATTWSGLQARYEAWMRLEVSNSVRAMAESSNWPWDCTEYVCARLGKQGRLDFIPAQRVGFHSRPPITVHVFRPCCLVSVDHSRCSR